MVTTKAEASDEPYSAKLNNYNSDDNDEAEEGAACSRSLDEIVDEHSEDDTSEENTMMFTFDDIPLYARCEYRGHKAWILDKGDHIMDNSSGRHLLIQYDEKMAGRDESKLHEKVVTRKLKQNDGELWIDFNHRLFDTAPEEDDA